MPKIRTSLAISFIIHAFIISVVLFLINKRPTPLLVNTNKSINVHFGSIRGLQSPKIYASKSNFKSINSSGLSSVVDSTSNELTHSTSENGNSSGEKNFNGEDSYNFEDLAVSYKEPVYPRLAIKRELQGTVKIRVKVSIDGKPIKTDILKSSGHDILDQAALDAVFYWQFQMKDVSYFVEKTIIFQLKN